MSAQTKFVGGIISFLIGVWLIIPQAWLTRFGLWGPGLNSSFTEFLKGAIPMVLIILGLIAMWIEWDEMKRLKNVSITHVKTD